MSLLTGKNYIVIPKATTVERLALTPANGMLVFDTTLNAFYKYEDGAWSGFSGGGGGIEVIGTSDVPSSVTNTGAITVFPSSGILVPANTVTTGDNLWLQSFFTRDGTAFAGIIYFYVNTTIDLTGAILMARLSTATGNFYYPLQRQNIFVVSPTSTLVSSTANAISNDGAVINNAMTSMNIDWTVNQYIFPAVDAHSATQITTKQKISLFKF